MIPLFLTHLAKLKYPITIEGWINLLFTNWFLRYLILILSANVAALNFNFDLYSLDLTLPLSLPLIWCDSSWSQTQAFSFWLLQSLISQSTWTCLSRIIRQSPPRNRECLNHPKHPHPLSSSTLSFPSQSSSPVSDSFCRVKIRWS